ncbi:tetratricopeptide repeat protein [Methylotenera sp.]|uniref:tetratricopeptide repeat protein n=1 Tax=Methylotenera sp. TaxID=2051956 RepID=UPI00248837C8|nr:tetratricopeptide repeat protein [Methylotenera sp.]MDI1362829.1 tetratricopeptide repeat protein [Methylotenera sp.]
MNKYISLLNALIARSFLVAAVSLLAPAAHADELKDISQLADQGQSAVAIDRLNTYILANPKNAQALFMKGVLLAEQGRRDEAIRTFTDVTEKFPNLPEPYNNLAVLYADQGQFDKARKALETAIKTHPSYATAHENLGDIYARMASEAYDKALQLDTSNTRAEGKLSMIKDLFGTGNKTTLASKEPVKVANPIRPADTKPADVKKVAVAPTKTAVEPAKVEPTKNVEPAKNSDADITSAVNNWAQAWSAKNLDQYFASYGASFQPAKGESRKAWEQQRRERITRPAKINVEVSNVNITSTEANSAKVRFKQSYRADSKPIYTTKTLVMKKQGNNWFIEQEIASN